jgi:transposase
MRRTELLQETRKMRFEEMLEGWERGRLTQEQAALVLGMSSRTFRRYVHRFEAEGVAGLADRRLEAAYHRQVPADEVFRLVELYRSRYTGFTAKHFHSLYHRLHEGQRSYTWVKKTLQAKGLVPKAPRRGAHRKRRPRTPFVGMMLHQDGSRHEWVPGQSWDLIITLDDATGEHYSMFFVEEEGTASSFRGVKEVIECHGLFGSLYTDRGSHYWHTAEAGGKVDRKNLTQFGRALRQLGIQTIPAYSPQARGRCERAFRTHQDRLTKELALAGITDMAAANRYLEEVYKPAYNAEFAVPAEEPSSAFVPWTGANLDDVLCEHHERTVGNDNCIRFENRSLQIPPDPCRCHYVRARVRVHRYPNGSLAIFYGPRKLANYDASGNLLKPGNLPINAKRKQNPVRNGPLNSRSQKRTNHALLTGQFTSC